MIEDNKPVLKQEIVCKNVKPQVWYKYDEQNVLYGK